MRGYWCLFSVSFWHLHFEVYSFGGEPSALEFGQSFPAMQVVEQEKDLCWDSALSSDLGLPLTGLVTSLLGLCHIRSQVTATSNVNIWGLDFFIFTFHVLKTLPT